MHPQSLPSVGKPPAPLPSTNRVDRRYGLPGWMIRFPRPGWATCMVSLTLLADNLGVRAGEFRFEFARPSLDRWMYSFNATPGCRPSAPVFGSLNPALAGDSRQGQLLLGFDFIAQTVTNCGTITVQPRLLPPGSGPERYLVRRARVTATVSRDRVFVLDTSHDGYRTYLPREHPEFLPDPDPGRPVELFGAGYRNGWDAGTFWETGPFGSSEPGGRNAFAAGFDTHGLVVDVGNNVGKTNPAFAPFEAVPFAVGTSPTIAPGTPVPAGIPLEFELDLANPLVLRYVQDGLHRGRLRFTLSSLHTSSFGGQPVWPDFHTRDSDLGDPPTLLIEGTHVDDVDEDRDGLPDDWERFHFGHLGHDADDDPDGDGADHGHEFRAGTLPTDPKSVLKLGWSRSPERGWNLGFSAVSNPIPVLERSRDGRTWETVPATDLFHRAETRRMEYQPSTEPDTGWMFRLRVP